MLEHTYNGLFFSFNFPVRIQLFPRASRLVHRRLALFDSRRNPQERVVRAHRYLGPHASSTGIIYIYI